MEDASLPHQPPQAAADSGTANVALEFSLVVPCFNERNAIEHTIADLRTTLTPLGLFELIVVDDGSTDGTSILLDRLERQTDELIVVRHGSNRGYGAALKTGITRARSDIVVITDADGTYPNHRIPDLVRGVKQAAMVVGARTGENVSYSRIRAFPKIFLRRYCSWIAGCDIPDINSGLRAMRRPVIHRFLKILPDTFSFTTTITLAFHTNYEPVLYIPIDYAARIGQSKIKPLRDTLRFIKLIVRTGIYFAPLRVLFPLVVALMVLFGISLAYDVFWLQNLTDKTILFLLFAMNVALFALLGDMIDKRTSR